MGQPLSRQTIGLPGVLGVFLLAVWAFGFLVLHVHARGWHLLVPVGVFLVLTQAVRRLNVAADDDD